VRAYGWDAMRYLAGCLHSRLVAQAAAVTCSMREQYCHSVQEHTHRMDQATANGFSEGPGVPPSWHGRRASLCCACWKHSGCIWM